MLLGGPELFNSIILYYGYIMFQARITGFPLVESPNKIINGDSISVWKSGYMTGKRP
jgi:hypothetical protein